MTKDRITTIREFLEKPPQLSPELFFSLYSPCSILYWYQNPLEGLPIDFLSPETVAEDTN